MPRYLECKTLTGEWWYKDLKTGEDLPMYTMPVNIYEKIDESEEEDYD